MIPADVVDRLFDRLSQAKLANLAGFSVVGAIVSLYVNAKYIPADTIPFQNSIALIAGVVGGTIVFHLLFEVMKKVIECKTKEATKLQKKNKQDAETKEIQENLKKIYPHLQSYQRSRLQELRSGPKKYMHGTSLEALIRAKYIRSTYLQGLENLYELNPICEPVLKEFDDKYPPPGDI